MRGFLKTEDVSDYCGLWMRKDGDAGAVAFDNMQNRAVTTLPSLQSLAIS